MQTSKRKKQNRKHLDFYRRTFRITGTPYQVLCDANFIHHFLKNKLGADLPDLHRFLAVVLDSQQINMLVCESSLVEIDELFGKESETYVFANKMEKTRCGRTEEESMATPPQVAIRKLVGNGMNRHGYLVATQDDELKEHFRGMPGIPLLFFQRALLLLEAPSSASLRFQAQQEQKKLLVPKEEKKRLASKLDASVGGKRAKRM